MQHCPNCGAENDGDAQFCAECGTPLDTQINPDTVDDDKTILSTNVNDVVEGQKTEIFKHNDGDSDDDATVVISEEVIEEIAVVESTIVNGDDVVEVESPPMTNEPPSAGGSETSGANGWMNQRNLIIGGIILLVLLCCCCCLIPGLFGTIFQKEIGDFINQTSQSPVLYLPVS